MKLRILGCSGGIGRDLRTTSMLLDDDVLIDAGTGVGDLSIEQLKRIDHVFLTHSHLDHVNGLVLSAGSMGGQKLIHARKQTIKDLEVIFADRLWPKLASHKKEDPNAMLVYSP